LPELCYPELGRQENRGTNLGKATGCIPLDNRCGGLGAIASALGGIARLLGVLLLVACPALGQGPCRLDFPHDSNPTPIVDEDICNFHQVDADLYRGGRPRPSAYAKLAKLGIRTIVNLEEPEYAEREKSVLDELNATLKPEQRIEFISFPIDQIEIAATGVPHERLQDLFQQIKKAQKPIFIHCYHGKDRTGAIVALYRMLRQEKSYEEATDEAFHYRLSRRDVGMQNTIDRYKNPKKLKSLPRP
jgi:tyrosine-protein phosphatase SIW14